VTCPGNVQVARLTAGTDPAGLIADGRTHIFESAVRNPTPVFHHVIDRTLTRCNLDEVEDPIRAIYAVSPLVQRLAYRSQRPVAVGYLASLLGRDEVSSGSCVNTRSLIFGAEYGSAAST
jgi:hypothetical protein